MIRYKATATLTDGKRLWDVVIFSEYESLEEALDGVKNFESHGYNVVTVRIDQEVRKGCGICQYWGKLMRYETCRSCHHYSNFKSMEG